MAEQQPFPFEDNASAATATIGFNPFDPAFRADPYATYRRLLEGPAIQPGMFDMYLLTRYADCAALLRDPRASSDQTKSDAAQAIIAQQAAIASDSQIEQQMRSFLFMDPPDHTRLRGLVNKAFTTRVIEGLRPRIQQLVDGLVAQALDRRSIEIIEDFAYPLPVRVISEMLGVPPEDHEQFKAWSRVLARALDPDFVLAPEVVEERNRASEAFIAYFQRLIATRRASPRDDLLSALIAAEEQGDKLTEEELLATCVLLLVAGHETTVNLIGNGTLALLRHPDQARRLREDPSLIKSGVEEMLRFDPPVQLTGRSAFEDIELPNGVLAKGKQAILLLGAANHDSRQFEHP